MNEKYIQEVRQCWALEMDYNLQGDKLDAMTKWLQNDVQDGELRIVLSAIRSSVEKKHSIKNIMMYVDDKRQQANISRNDDVIEKVECGLCGKTGWMYVIWAYSTARKRRAPWAVRDSRGNYRALQPLIESSCQPHPCFCSNADAINSDPRWQYNPRQLRRIADMFGLRAMDAYDIHSRILKLSAGYKLNTGIECPEVI